MKFFLIRLQLDRASPHTFIPNINVSLAQDQLLFSHIPLYFTYRDILLFLFLKHFGQRSTLSLAESHKNKQSFSSHMRSYGQALSDCIPITKTPKSHAPGLKVCLLKQCSSCLHTHLCVSSLIGMGSMPNLSVGLSSMPVMSAMPILTPIPVNPNMHSVQPLVPTPMTLPLISCLGNSGLPNGNVNLLPLPLVANNAGWFCGGTTQIGLSRLDLAVL